MNGYVTIALPSPSFENIWKLPYGSINGVKLSNFVNNHKPDIVIYQVVERALYNQGIVTSLPEIQAVEPSIPLNTNKLEFDINIPSFTFFKNERISLEDGNAIVTHTDPIIILREILSFLKKVKDEILMSNSTCLYLTVLKVLPPVFLEG